MSSLQNRVKQMQQEIPSGSSLGTTVGKRRDKTFRKKTRSSGTALKGVRKNSRTSLLQNTKQKYPQPLNLNVFNDMNENTRNSTTGTNHIPRSEYSDQVIPVTPDAESGLNEDHSRKAFYQNIQERLLSVDTILDQYEVSSSSSSDNDEHVSFESTRSKEQANASNDLEVKSTSSRNSSIRHPYYQSVQNTVASLCSHDEENKSLSKSDLNMTHSNHKNLSGCQNPYYQSVQNLGGQESVLNTVAPVKTIIYGHPESMKSKSRQHDDLTTLTASETATVLSGGTDFQIPYTANIDKILEDESLGPTLCTKDNVIVPDTPDFSLASDEAVMGSQDGNNLNKKYTQSPNFPRKISFQNEKVEAGYTSLKDLVNNETVAKVQIAGVSPPAIPLENHVQMLTETYDCSDQDANQFHNRDYEAYEAPATPVISKIHMSKYTDLDLVTTPLQSREELRSPFKAISKEGHEISHVKESDEYDDCDSSTQSHNNGGMVASSSLDLFKKKKCSSQECACVIM